MAAPVGQNNWRFCNKCYGLWWNGYPDNGHCPAGGAHVAVAFGGKGGSWDFVLAADPSAYPGPE
jgi:hypothetical protein